VKKSPKHDLLFSGFPPVSTAHWEDLIKKDLKGADYRSELKWETLEGVNILPFYRQEDLNNIPDFQSSVKAKPSWRRCEKIYASNVQDINEAVHVALKGGSDSVQIFCRITSGDRTIGGNITGAEIHSQSDFNRLLQGDVSKNIRFFFDSGMASPALLSMFLNAPGDLTEAAFMFDPFTYMAKHGRKPHTDEHIPLLISQMCGHENIHSLSADGLFYHHSGCTIVQEVAIVLAIAAEYLAFINDSEREKAAKSFFVRVSAGPLYFPEIAKFRALRKLWKNLLGAYGLSEDIHLHIHAETTPQNKTATDPYNNMLRATTEAMSAVLGGVDSLTVVPFDAGFQKPDDFSLRIARNVHHIISGEAHLNKVCDPAGGSYYIEKLTDQIAKEAWNFFRLIENQGGFVKALENRVLQSEINSSRSQKMESYSTRNRVLTGTNNYPNPEEKLPESFGTELPVTSLIYSKEESEPYINHLVSALQEHFKNGGSIGDVSKTLLDPQKVLYKTLNEFNAGKLFESIRRKTREISKKRGRIPHVSLIPVGNRKWRAARSAFAQNLLGCAGFKIDNPSGFEAIGEAVDETESGRSDIFVLCSSDQEYTQLVKPFCDAFKSRGILILAGNPGKDEQKYRDLGIDEFMKKGMDLPEFLTRLQEKTEKECDK
jgi:methylmalonyl-CoA mutase